MKGKNLNLTLLDPFEVWAKRGIIHRDYMAHLFRWAFVGKLIKRNSRILDVGAGIGNLAKVLYRNRLKPREYIALETHDPFIKKLNELENKVNFPMLTIPTDIREGNWLVPSNHFDFVCCFEVIEHFEPKYLPNVLENMKASMKPSGRILLSTPNYDGIHKAKNHVHEYEEGELSSYIYDAGLEVLQKYGTFMSLGRPKDAREILAPAHYDLFKKLYPYYNSSVLSILFAPAYPSESRNILWVLRRR